MSQTSDELGDHTIRELAPTATVTDRPWITRFCEPVIEPGHSCGRGKLSVRLRLGTTLAEAQAIASVLSTRVNRVCHVTPQVLATT